MVNKAKTKKVMNQFIPKRANIVQTGGQPLELPNLNKGKAPESDRDLANKKYVDDEISGAGHWTDTSTNTGTNKTLNSSTNDIHADSIHELLRNETGATINKGDAVFISGYNVGLDRALVTLADSTSSATMPSVALVEDDSIANNATGEFVEAGTLVDVNTGSWSVGDALWVSETGTTGNTLTNTKPTGTTEIQKVGEVLRSHAARGVIEVFGAGRVNDLPNVATHTMSMGSTKLTSVTDPTSDQDAATKKYVDDNLHAEIHTMASHSDDDTYNISTSGSSSVASSSISNQSSCRVYKNSDQSVDTGTITRVDFDAEVYDHLNEFNLTTNFFTATTAGIYLVTVNMGLENLDDGKLFELWIYHEAVARGKATMVSAAANQQIILTTTAMFKMAVDDELEIRVRHNNGSALNIYGDVEKSNLCIHKLA